MKKLIIILLAFLLMLHTASAAITSFGNFGFDGNDPITEAEINLGEEIEFEVVFVSNNYPITYDVAMFRDNDGMLMHTYANDVEIVDNEGMIYRATYEIEPDHYGNEIGEYTIFIIGTDSDPTTSRFELNLIVVENNAPVAVIDSPNDDFEASTNVLVQFRGHGTDADGDRIIAYSWGFGDDTLSTIQNPSHSYNEEGNYIVTFRVQDENGAWSGTDTVNIIINEIGENHAPTAFIDLPQDNSEHDVNELIQFRGRSEDEDGDDIIAYSWDFGNGIGSFERIFQYSYDEAGNYEVSFRVQDENGLWSEFDTVNIIVNDIVDENIAPIVNIESPQSGEIISGIYNIEWDSSDVDGEITSTKIYYKRILGVPLFQWINDLFRVNDGYRLLVNLGDSDQTTYNWDTTRLSDNDYVLKIVVADDDGAQGYDVVRVEVDNFRGENNAPIITSEPVTSVRVNTIYRYDVNARDPDGDNINYRLRNAPDGMRIDPESGVIMWMPISAGRYQGITVIASDGELSDSQVFTLNVLAEALGVVREPVEVHEFSISNVIVQQDSYNVYVYVQVMNKGNQDEKILLKAMNMQTGETALDHFVLDNKDNYWRILQLPRPGERGVYTIGVWGNSKDYKDILYREIMVY